MALFQNQNRVIIMSWIDKKTDQQRYTLKERQDYHNRQAKKGATKFDYKSKRQVKVSDFERGAHKAMANMIFQKRKSFAEKMKSNPRQSNYKNNQYVKPTPTWYKDYEKEMFSNSKHVESNESLDSLKNYFRS